MISAKAVALAVQGSGHRRRGVGCQDAAVVCVMVGHVVILAVADGAGSATHSDIGAKVAVAVALNLLAEDLAILVAEDGTIEQRLGEAAVQAKRAVEEEARRLALEPRELASTLILCVASQTRISVLHIGDGAVVARTVGGEFFCVSKPMKGEHFNETDFLTGKGAERNGRFSEMAVEVSDIAAFSDGLEFLALDLSKFEPHARFFEPLFTFFRESNDLDVSRTELMMFLESPKVAERVDDDLSLVLACWSSTEGDTSIEQGSEA